MASWLSFTNHKLYQCRLLLQQADTTTQPQALHEALQDSALYALRDAYLSYLHELAELATYRQPVSGLAQLLADTPLITGEMKELECLENDSFSWLKAMLRAAEAVGQADSKNHSQPQALRPGMIQLHQEDQPDISAWLSQLTQLIDLQRENRQES